MLDIYEKSRAVELLRESGTIVFLDLDRTLWSPDEGEYSRTLEGIRKEIRHSLQKAGAVTVFTTARTPELVMSSGAFTASARLGFNRLPPLLHKDEGGRRSFLPIEEKSEFNWLLDPDLMHSFGCGIYGAVGDGYAPDSSYNDKPGSSWRPAHMRLIEQLDAGSGTILGRLGAIESAENYHLGRADVLPHPYRIQFDFKDADSDHQKVALKRTLAEALRNHPELCGKSQIVDESRPEDRKFCFYLAPKRKTKERALQHMTANLVRAAGISARSLRIFVAGDALTDLASAYAGPSCEFWYCLPAKAPLSETLRNGGPDASFAGESIAKFVRRLTPDTGLPAGHYRFSVPGKRDRRFVIGDISAPAAGPPWSVLHALDAFLGEGSRRS